MCKMCWMCWACRVDSFKNVLITGTITHLKPPNPVLEMLGHLKIKYIFSKTLLAIIFLAGKGSELLLKMHFCDTLAD